MDPALGVVPRWRNVLDVVSTISMTAAALVLIVIAVRFPWTAASSPPASPPANENLLPDKLPLGNASWGRDGAGVALVEFTDFNCPACAQFARDVLPTIEQEYVGTGKIRLAFRNFPLEKLHPLAFQAAEAAQCAADRGQAAAMYALLYKVDSPLDRAGLGTLAQRVGLAEHDLTDCLAGSVATKVRQDISEGRALKIRGTPTFFVGMVGPGNQVQTTKRFTGTPPLEVMTKALDDALEARVSTSKK